MPGIEEQAADAYRFDLQLDGQIRWEIPSLGEVLTGKTDEQPMEVHRAKPLPGMTSASQLKGRRCLCTKWLGTANWRVKGE